MKKTQEEFSETLKTVKTVAELLDQYEELVKFPESYETKVTSYNSKTGKPKTTKERPTKPNMNMTVGFAQNTLLKPSDSLITKVSEFEGVYIYKGKLYLFTQWNDERNFYSGTNIERVEPKKIK
jgi:hypothetical protein